MQGKQIYKFIEEIFPITRSITGEGNRETLSKIKNILPDLKIFEVPSGTRVYDWEIPREWNIKDAYVLDSSGTKIIDYKKNNLHVLNYSIPVDKTVDLEELNNHLYSSPELPDAIPYVTSYYDDRWGFCLSHNDRKKLKNQKYRIKIDSELSDGSLTYGELLIPGESEKEVLISTYICHPSMANNECSGIGVATYLAKWILELKKRRYTYRVVFLPETIGSITYINKNIDILKKNVVCGFVVTCVGDDLTYSFMPSREGDTLADKISQHVLDRFVKKYDKYSFLERGSDERQYCHPEVDLPVVSIMRSKYGTYPEYHTSLDNLDFISPRGLDGSYSVLKKCVQLLEGNRVYKNQVICEPKMSKRNLHPKDWRMRHLDNRKDLKKRNTDMMNVMVYSDGKRDVVDVCEKINVDFETCLGYINILRESGVLRFVQE